MLRLPRNRRTRPATVPPSGTNAPASRPTARIFNTAALSAVYGHGLVAAALGVVISLLARLFFGILTPAELFGDRLTIFIPLPVFSQLLSLFGPNAKHLFYGTLLVLDVLLTALTGALYVRLRAEVEVWLLRREPPRQFREIGWYDAPLLALWVWALSAGVLAPVLGGGLFGATLTGGAGELFVSEVGPNVAFALSFVALRRRFDTTSTAVETQTGGRLARRRLLRQAGVTVTILAGGGLAWELVSSGMASILGIGGPRPPRITVNGAPGKIVPPPVPSYGSWAPVDGQTAEVTPTSSFYYVSKNLAGDPQVGQASWKLSITGLVNAPYTLSYADLQLLPKVERYHTLECISNEVGGNLMSNASFTGVRLADVINTAGIQTGASTVIFRGADGYSDSLHLSQALHPDALIAYLINGQPLPQAHGFPARLLIPGVYGMKNGKWLTALELASGSYTGYWEQQGWTNEARVKMTSRVDVPRDGDLLVAGTRYVAGVAYAADRGIARVDVSTDGGATWRPATLRRPLGNLTWVLWEYPWNATSGRYVIAARAIDLQGNVQIPAYTPPLPDGSSGYDAVSVVVR
ncbi:MAG TPA: molybdopterin-dependent oxidoreductase [Ktedonobacterales bacterium]|nr:molybdopterin-dependent oxidoreductase [Ktedonobacterales bacterium]